MADNVSAVFSVLQCLSPAFTYLAAHSGYISKFDDNLKELKTALEGLKAKIVDVEREVHDGELKGEQRLDEVKWWLSEVKTILIDANKLDAEASAVQQRRSSSGCCSNNIISTYRCGKKIPKMLNVVKNYSEKVFEVVTRQATPPVVEVEPVQQTFGLDAKLEMTWNRLMEDSTRMLGLYGIGGVGKTTLLSLICNNFTKFENKFDVVIWVTVSKDVDIMKIQDDIGKRLGLYDENWCRKTQREKRGEIHRVLNDWKPRFVLLLDDLWKEVSLSKIGIPVRGREYKIVFTTRSINVCQNMKGIQIEVEGLADKDALDLLKHISGRDKSTGEMLGLAEKIAKKCHGLPLALKVIGKCLSSKTTEDEWGKVLDHLSSYPDLVEGMENKMFGILKVSYDYLEEEDAQSCFLYCALFPEAYKIKEDELVEYWIGENIIDVRRGRDRAKIRGDNIINTLVGAGLLLKDEESKQKVFMPNMIREMALTIVSAIRDGKMFIVKTNAGLERLPDVTDWTIVSKMSLMNNEIQDITEDPEFPDQTCLITLFLQNNKLVEISYKFFVVMSTLVVLDLSSNKDIRKLPDEISELVSLQFLKLLGTRIMYLPEGFSKLVKLIHLDLESTNELCSISQISGLRKLQVLRFYGSAAALDISLLKNLEGLRDLQLLTITVREVDVLKAFLGSNVLPSRTQGLYLGGLEVTGVSGKSFAATFGELGRLSKLGMTDCDIKESETEWEENRSHQCSSASSSSQITPSNMWFKNLSAVVLYACKGIRDLTWLIYAGNLESLNVKNSSMMVEVISKEKAGDVEDEPFKKLQVLDLGFLNELQSIYWSSLSFKRLQKVNITKCPKLRKLPLNSTSVERIDDLHIEVDEGWLDGVEWESGAEERFHNAFHTASVPVE